jgi:diadenosine tetraphosphate (Ap4A) HIT family hydrolase
MTHDSASTDWILHPQLARDTAAVGDLPLSRVLLIDDANYPWILLVPRRSGAVEILDLSEPDRRQLMDEISLASRVMKDMTRCDKINVAALGNVVPQLHVHVIGRARSDAAWPRPVWGVAAARRYGEADLKLRLANLHERFEL